MNLGTRLARAYAAVILIALLIFAGVAILIIDRTMRYSMDTRLNAEAHAAASLADVQKQGLIADREDREQFLTLIAAGDNGLILDNRRRVVLSSSANPPQALLAQPANAQGYYTLRYDDSEIRAVVFPIMHHGGRVGTVAMWRDAEWIHVAEREAGIAFVAAAVIIAFVSLLAGGAVTRRALEDAFARQRRFTADASHELRAPLAVIRAEADLALRKERSVPEYQSTMETIADEADRMETLIGDLLSAARAESGRVEHERVDAAAVVRRVAERLSSAAAAKEAAIDVVPMESALVFGDRDALERALLAIGHNAVKYAPQHGRVRFELHRDGSVEIVVRDNGPGFSEDALQHALERFWREGTGRPQSGTGLGLAIAKSIVEAFDGTIVLQNASGGGAIVRLRIPVAPR